MAQDKVLYGAIAIIKVKGVSIGKMQSVRINESYQRVPVSEGLGSIYDAEFPVTKFKGQCTCSFFEVDYTKSGIPGAINRIFGSKIQSQIASGNNVSNFEDQLVLDDAGVDLEIYKKVTDIIDPATGLIIPKAVPYASLRGMVIESDNVNISDGQVSGRDQSFMYKRPVVQ